MVQDQSSSTPEGHYLDRRTIIRGMGLGVVGLSTLGLVNWLSGMSGTLAGQVDTSEAFRAAIGDLGKELFLAKRSEKYTIEPRTLTPEKIASVYNNFYEFGTQKDDPHRNSGDFRPAPWTVRIGGEVNKPGDYQLEDLLSPQRMEDRVYRLRCVEAWSMVIPWRGFPLADLINRVEPTGKAKFLEFKTVVRPEEMPGQRAPILQWPYVEGLRMDEAMNPLTLMVTGLFGMDLPNQNGAPLRLIVPWKYGFKGVKSIVSIDFVENMPLNTWKQMQSNEYGFYANVNPEVSHPRWSQAREIRLPGLFKSHPTQMFNGYGDQVAHMYAGMDLRRWY